MYSASVASVFTAPVRALVVPELSSGESGVVGVRGVDHAAVFLVGECLDGRVVVADDARGVLHDEKLLIVG